MTRRPKAAMTAIRLAIPPTRSRHFPCRLLVLILNVAEQLRTAAWTSILPSIIDAAERDAEDAAMQSSLQQNNTAPFYAVIESAKARGEVLPHTSAPDLVAMLLGPLLYRRWFSKETREDPFVDAAVKAATCAQAHGAAVGDSTLMRRAAGPENPCPVLVMLPVGRINP